MVSRVIVESKLNYTNTKGNKKYFTIKHLRARAQTGERREGDSVDYLVVLNHGLTPLITWRF